ncbi:acetone carboxylase [uncultured Jatrophihabitans sp.]|uniref:acetone carboxylase n=1 Tax=uncultured Jatrophihabitans sp. TaxID=1610747 RepID=UPI0035CBC949
MRSESRYGTSLYGAWVSVPDVEESPRCSARGCRQPAAVDLSWRNPRLHTATRVKHWLACPEHSDDLAGFLTRRGFLLERGPLR